MLKLTATFAILLVYLSFTWSFRVFRKEVPRALAGFRLVQLCTFLLWILTWVELRRATSGFEAVVIAELLAGLLFWWTVWAVRGRGLSYVFSYDSPSEILRRGPYSYFRHPAYLAYSIGYAVPGLAFGSWALIGVSVLLIGVYLRAGFLEERKFRDSSLGGEYAEYRRRVGVLGVRGF